MGAIPGFNILDFEGPDFDICRKMNAWKLKVLFRSPPKPTRCGNNLSDEGNFQYRYGEHGQPEAQSRCSLVRGEQILGFELASRIRRLCLRAHFFQFTSNLISIAALLKRYSPSPHPLFRSLSHVPALAYHWALPLLNST